MRKTRVFRSGNSQAVRLPKDFRLEADEVQISRRGDEIVLRPLGKGLGQAYALLIELPPDFMAAGRRDEPPQRREPIE
jgi:antitoxin VapB